MWILENETSTAFEARLFSFMDSGFAFVDLCTQVGEASFQVLLVVPTIGEGPHILFDSLRILPGNFVFAMDREGYEALQVAPDLVQQLCSTDAYLLFDFGFSSELHLVVCHIAEAKAMPFALRFPSFCTIPIYSARTFQLPKKIRFFEHLAETLWQDMIQAATRCDRVGTEASVLLLHAPRNQPNASV